MSKGQLTQDSFDGMIQALDVNGDGKVTKDELKEQYMKMFPKTKPAEFDAVWSEMDKNKDNELSTQELATYYGFKLNSDGDEGMTDEQILEALQMQAQLVELQEASEKTRKSLTPQAKETKKVSATRNSSGVTTIKMPTRTSASVEDLQILFLQACELGDKADVDKRLSAEGSSAVNILLEDDKGEMAMHKLARHGLCDQVRKVLEKCTSVDQTKTLVNWQDKNGKSPIFVAAEYGHSDLVAVFIERGAEPTLENNTGWTVLHAAVNSNKVEVCERILAHEMINKREIIDRVDKSKRTAMHIASFKTNEGLVEVLIKYGANISVVDSSGNAPVELAKKAGRRKSKELLEAYDPTKK